MANAISSLKIGDVTCVITTPYATCSTAASTDAKVATISQGTNFSLETGARVTVKFTVTNTASSPTLNVNSTGAKAIYYRGSAISAGYLAANRTYEFVYNGTQYELVGDIDTNTNTTTTTGATDTSSKIFLVGATSQSSAPTTYSHDTAYVDTDGCVYSNSKKTATLGDNQTFTGMNSFTSNVSCQSGVMATNGSSLLDNASLKYNEITRYKDGTTYNLSIPEKSGTLATTSDIPSTSSFVTTGTAQTITGTKTFTSRAEFNSGIATSGTNDFKVQGLYDVSLPTKTGTVALTSDIPSTSNFASLSGVNEFTGSNTFTTNVTVKSSNSLVAQGSTALNHTDYSFGKIVHTPDATKGNYTLTLPEKSGTIALTSDIPSSGGVDIAQVNENFLKDPTKTYLVVNTSDFSAGVSTIPDGSTVDWGDGSTSAAGSSFSHTYSDGHTVHLITITGLTSIPSSFLSGKSGITKVSISDNVTVIKSQAFLGCSSLKELYVGSGVTSYEMVAVANCAQLRKIVIAGTTPATLGTSVFTASSNARIMVPPSAVDTYRSASVWSTYSSQIGREINSADLPGHIYLHRVSFDIVSGDTKGYFTVVNNDNTALSSLTAARIQAFLGNCFPAAIDGETYSGGTVSVHNSGSGSTLTVKGAVLSPSGQSTSYVYKSVNISDLSDTVTQLI